MKEQKTKTKAMQARRPPESIYDLISHDKIELAGLRVRQRGEES